MKYTKKEYEDFLNGTPLPEHDAPENGGRVPFFMKEKYGTWLRKNDPIQFEIGYLEWRKG
jgi:hypothetical protein